VDTAANSTTVLPENVAIVWTNAPPLWSSCRSRAHLTIIITIPCHFTANATTVLATPYIEIFNIDNIESYISEKYVSLDTVTFIDRRSSA